MQLFKVISVFSGPFLGACLAFSGHNQPIASGGSPESISSPRSAIFPLSFWLKDSDSTWPPGVPALAAGVSATLAVQRSALLHDITYDLQFHIPAQRDVPIPAEEQLSFTLADSQAAAQPLAPLVLDFKEKTSPQQLQVNGVEVPVVHQLEHLVIPPEFLHPGHNTIHILFTAGNGALNRNRDFLYTLLVPDRARTLFPCFDQPDLKAVFTLTLVIPADWKALGNAPVKDTIAVSALTGQSKALSSSDPGAAGPVPPLPLTPENTQTLHFLPSDKISTYLFSFAAGKFIESHRSVDGRPMHFYYRETDSVKLRMSLGPIFRIQGDALQFMKEYTGLAFPFQKFDFVAIPDFQFGGMEHPGAIQYKASALFLDSGATRDQVIARSNVLSHETAHMWFGDLVTMSWFNDVWMKEVFANFMADKISNITLPDGKYDLKFLTDHFPAAYSIDRTAGAHPIRQQLDNLQEAGSLYGNIIYHKAPIMMRQLERLMGPEAFRDGLRDYLKQYAGANASWPDLIRKLEGHTAVDLEAWNRVWVNEPGRPRFSYRLRTEKDHMAKDHMAKDRNAKDHTAKDGTAKSRTAENKVTKDGTEEEPTAKDGKVKEGTAKNEAVKDEKTTDGSAKDKKAKDGIVKDGMTRDGVAKDGMTRAGQAKDRPAKNKITELEIRQQGEDGSSRIWPQLFEIALVYEDPGSGNGHYRVEELTVNMDGPVVRIPAAIGKEAPLCILFNSSGQGYGVFPVDPRSLHWLFNTAITTTIPTSGSTIPPANTMSSAPLMRASAYINLYENMLDGSAVSPRRLLVLDRRALARETEELNLNLVADQLVSIYWRFLSPATRDSLAGGLEKDIWQAMTAAASANEKKTLFRTYTNIVLSKQGQDRLFAIWKRQEPPAGVKLSEEDYTNLAASLALRAYPGERKILEEQLARIQNDDRRQRLIYLLPALSGDVRERDRFFDSLTVDGGRKKEAWVLTGLSYLHHPLRTTVSEKYLPRTLDLLSEIQRTGDVFFPQSWLQTSFAWYRTKTAAAIVRRFLRQHPDYNPKLKAKILQATDNLFRASR